MIKIKGILAGDFIQNSVRYLMQKYDYEYCIELAFIDAHAMPVHDESRCFMTALRINSDFDYTPNRNFKRNNRR